MKTLISLFLIVVFGILGCAATWFWGRPAYRCYREKHALAQAVSFFSARDYRNASLSARQTLLINPNNLEACQIMADLAELVRSPQALDWRRRIIEISPTIENKLKLASLSLRTQTPPFAIAAQALDEIGEAGESLPAFHIVSADLAIRRNRPQEAARHFEHAMKLEPTNELHTLNLSVLRLQSTNEAQAAAARVVLENLASRTNLGVVALRWLIADSLKHSQLQRAEQFSSELLSDPAVTLEDRLQYLSILQAAKSPLFPEKLSALQAQACTNAVQIYGTTSWMINHGMVGEARIWLANCPAKTLSEIPAPLAFVDIYMATKDWVNLEEFLQEQKWGEMEFLRDALLSKVAIEQKQTLAADSRWRSAVREAGERLGPLMTLLSMANAWGREKGKEDLLWQIVQRFPRERWALKELDTLYASSGNTRGLNKLYGVMAGRESSNYLIQNNLASTSLLLKQNLTQAHQTAKEVYAQHAENPAIASTYAFSLHLQGRTSDGLEVLQKATEESLQTPAIALYYGVLLAASGETNRASKYLTIASSASLLPEEKSLMAEASRNSAGL